MFCSKCGNELPEGATICAECGNKVGARVKAAHASAPRDTDDAASKSAKEKPAAKSITSGTSLADLADDNRLPLGQLILSIVAVITLFLPWEVATVITQGSANANLIDTLQLVAYNMTHSNNLAGPVIFMLICLGVGMLLMLIGSGIEVASKKGVSGTKPALIGAAVVVVLTLVILTNGTMSGSETLLSYAYSTSMTMAPMVCLIASAGVGVISFARR